MNAQLESLAADSGLGKDSAQSAERRLRLMRAVSDQAAESQSDAAGHLAEYLQNLRTVEDLLLGGRPVYRNVVHFAVEHGETHQRMLDE